MALRNTGNEEIWAVEPHDSKIYMLYAQVLGNVTSTKIRFLYLYRLSVKAERFTMKHNIWKHYLW